MTIFWLRLEGLVILAVALMVYQVTGCKWGLFALLLLAPDVSIIGYLFSKKAGAWVYNFGHSLVLPLLLTSFGYLYLQRGILSLGLIWVAHIGLDRVLGYGLKEIKGFKYTHLGQIGRQ